jgi:hypothetical protein
LEDRRAVEATIHQQYSRPFLEWRKRCESRLLNKMKLSRDSKVSLVR